MVSQDSQYSGLAFAGAAPFAICAVLPLVGISSVAPFGDLARLAAVYGLAILAFICGTHWTLQLTRPGRTPFNLFYSSNAIFLAVGFAFVTLSETWALLAQVVAFLALLFVDRHLQNRELLTRDYFRVRAIATTVACLSLGLIAIAP